MTDKTWPYNFWDDVDVIRLPFVLGVPENSTGFEIQVICENGEFIKRSVNNENVSRS